MAAAGDVYRLTLTSTGQNSIYQNTFALQTLTAPPPTAANFGTFVTDYLAVVRPQQVATLSYVQWDAVQLWGDGMTVVAGECRREGGLQFGLPLTALPGLQAGDGLPPQSAMVLTLLTGNTGRRKRGRLYVPGQAESNQVDGTWSGTYMTSITTALNSFINIYKAIGGTSPVFSLGVWSERTASGCVPGPRPPGGHVQVDVPKPDEAYTPVNSALARPIVYSQRRRTRGVGR